MAVTKDVAAARTKAETENYIENLRIQREEGQYAVHKQTQTANIGAFQAELQAEIGKAGAEALGQMGKQGAGDVNLGGNNGGGFNPAAMMAGMTLGGAVGQNLAGVMTNALQGNKDRSVTTPPLIPREVFYVASNGKPTGPYTLDELTEMAEKGVFKKESLVWKKGIENWVKAGKLQELHTVFENSIPPIPPQE